MRTLPKMRSSAHNTALLVVSGEFQPLDNAVDLLRDAVVIASDAQHVATGDMTPLGSIRAEEIFHRLPRSERDDIFTRASEACVDNVEQRLALVLMLAHKFWHRLDSALRGREAPEVEYNEDGSINDVVAKFKASEAESTAAPDTPKKGSPFKASSMSMTMPEYIGKTEGALGHYLRRINILMSLGIIKEIDAEAWARSAVDAHLKRVNDERAEGARVVGQIAWVGRQYLAGRISLKGAEDHIRELDRDVAPSFYTAVSGWSDHAYWLTPSRAGDQA